MVAAERVEARAGTAAGAGAGVIVAADIWGEAGAVAGAARKFGGSSNIV